MTTVNYPLRLKSINMLKAHTVYDIFSRIYYDPDTLPDPITGQKEGCFRYKSTDNVDQDFHNSMLYERDGLLIDAEYSDRKQLFPPKMINRQVLVQAMHYYTEHYPHVFDYTIDANRMLALPQHVMNSLTQDEIYKYGDFQDCTDIRERYDYWVPGKSSHSSEVFRTALMFWYNEFFRGPNAQEPTPEYKKTFVDVMRIKLGVQEPKLVQLLLKIYAHESVFEATNSSRLKLGAEDKLAYNKMRRPFHNFYGLGRLEEAIEGWMLQGEQISMKGREILEGFGNRLPKVCPVTGMRLTYHDQDNNSINRAVVCRKDPTLAPRGANLFITSRVVQICIEHHYAERFFLGLRRGLGVSPDDLREAIEYTCLQLGHPWSATAPPKAYKYIPGTPTPTPATPGVPRVIRYNFPNEDPTGKTNRMHYVEPHAPTSLRTISDDLDTWDAPAASPPGLPSPKPADPPPRAAAPLPAPSPAPTAPLAPSLEIRSTPIPGVPPLPRTGSWKRV